jgi:hypothetical protein
MNALKGWRTIALNVITLAVLLVGGLTGQITDPVTLRYMGITLTVLNIVLRWLTDGPVALKSGGGA